MDGELTRVSLPSRGHGAEASAGTGVAGAARGHGRDTRLHGKQVGVAASVERDVDDLLALNRLADLSVCGLYLRRILSDGDCLARIHDL